MTEMDDIELLAQYTQRQSEAAFATLVERYIHLVYSAAMRSVGNPHQAEEITQAVFILLAKKAGDLSKHTVLSGWLYQTARLTAANFRRAEIRRAHREQEAFRQSLADETESNAWPQVAPLLDDAISTLDEKDRNAILLRFFERKNLRDVGLAIGASEDAAKMRVNRAVEKLRIFFTKRGVALSATALAATVSAHAIQAAPVGLAVKISAAALTAVATTATLAATKAVALSAFQKTLISTVLVCLGAATSFVLQHHAAAKLRTEVGALRQAGRQLRAENDRLANLLNQVSPVSSSNRELLKLRGAVGILKRQTNELKRLAETDPFSAEQANRIAEGYLPRETWRSVGFGTPEDAFQSSAWAVENYNIAGILDSLTPKLREKFKDRKTADGLNKILDYPINGMGRIHAVKEYRVVRKEVRSDNEVILHIWYGDYYDHGTVQGSLLKRVDGQWKFAARPGIFSEE